MNILALDIGVSSVKAAILDVAAGQSIGGIAKAEYSLDSPVPEAADVPAERLWQATAQAARAAVQQAKVAGQPGRDVEAVGLSTFMPALVLLDKADRPLAPIWTPSDRRARPAARQVWAAVGDEFLATVGNRPLPGSISALCFLQQLTQEPYLVHDVQSYFHVNGWLAFHMTGAKAFDRGNACFTGLYGTLTDQQWSKRWCLYFEVDPAWLPPVVCGSATVGHLRSAAAAELGVPAGIPVKLGTADISSAMLAAGMETGDLLHMVGATQVLAAFTDRPVASHQRLTRQLGVGDRFIHITHNPVGIVALDWIHHLCFLEQSRDEFFARTIPQALERKPRVSLDPPFLAGDPLETEACRAAFRDLERTTDRLDLLAAVVHAMVRRHREAIAALGLGPSFRRIFLTGSGAEVIRRLLPEFQGTSIHLLEEGSLLGIARLFTA